MNMANGNPAVPQQPQLPTVANITCAECKNEIQVRIPRPKILNFVDLTLITFGHERLDKCPHCASVYTFSIPNITETGMLVLQWVQLKQPSAIAAPTSDNMRAALANTDLADKLKQ